MRKVVYSLIPIILFATYLYGLRVLVMLSVVCFFGVITEYFVMRTIDGQKAKVTEAVFVSCILYTLSLPPSIPYWVAIVGIVFGIGIGKGIFGGFGKNVFNPAILARCFVYVSFPAYTTVTWTTPFQGFPGGFLKYHGGVDAMTSATPMILFKNDSVITPLWNLFVGTIAGSMGEGSALLILAAAVYLIVTKTASSPLIYSTMISFLGLQSVLYFAKLDTPNPIFSFFSGGFLYAAVFMVTDPISAPKEYASKIYYGVLIGFLTVIIRQFSLFTEGVMFAILIANIFAPLMDKLVKDHKAKLKEARA